MKNEREKLTFIGGFCRLFSAWKIIIGRKQATKKYNLKLFVCCLSVILWLDKGDFPENLHTVSK